VIGGLFSATFLTLLVLPSLYVRMFRDEPGVVVSVPPPRPWDSQPPPAS
jgi:hypothetical protein